MLVTETESGSDEQTAAIEYNTWAAQDVFPDGLPDQFMVDWLEGACFDPSSPEFSRGVARFQAQNDLLADGKLGTRTLGVINRVYSVQAHVLLTDDAKSEIVSYTVKFEGGKKNPYAACNLDAEYEGKFDRPKSVPIPDRTKRHRASKYNEHGGFHIGLSYGAWQAAQEPGALGSLLTQMYRAAPTLFEKTFGANSSQLLKVTTSKNRRTGVRSARTQPVGGADLWAKVWTKRFQSAADQEVFRDAQRKWVAKNYLDPALKTAEDYNLDSRGDLAVLFDVAVQFGVGGMRKYVKKALQPNQPWDKDHIKKVISQLPESRRHRRELILEAAGTDIRFTW